MESINNDIVTAVQVQSRNFCGPCIFVSLTSPANWISILLAQIGVSIGPSTHMMVDNHKARSCLKAANHLGVFVIQVFLLIYSDLLLGVYYELQFRINLFKILFSFKYKHTYM